MMDFSPNYSPAVSDVEELEVASAQAGFDQRELLDLLNTELDVAHLLEYLTAVVSNRMN